jgi:DNA-binding transcriptional regulator YiaG
MVGEDLYEEIKKLHEEFRQMRSDMDVLAASIATIRSDLPEFHAPLHEALSAFQTRTKERLSSLEDIMSLPETPRPKQRDQTDILRALLSAQNGKFVPAEDIRHKMGLNKVQFSQLLRVSKSFIEEKKNPLDGRRKLVKINY